MINPSTDPVLSGSEKTRTATPAVSRWANAPIALLTRTSRDGSKLPAMPGLGGSPYYDAGRSSSDRATYAGAGMRLKRLSFLVEKSVRRRRCRSS
jgi:hypothetical protein